MGLPFRALGGRKAPLIIILSLALLSLTVVFFQPGRHPAPLGGAIPTQLFWQAIAQAEQRGWDVDHTNTQRKEKWAGHATVVRPVIMNSKRVLLAIPFMSKVNGYNVHEDIVLKGGWAEFETLLASDIFKRFCGTQENLFIDVGSNIGWFSMLAASHGCRAWAFDGNLEALTYLDLSVRLNSFDALVSTFPALVSSEPSVEYNGWAVGDKSHDIIRLKLPGAVTTRTISLDAVVTESIPFLKVDVEGWEPSVFKSAKGLIQGRKIKYIYLEVTYKDNNKWNEDYVQTMLLLGTSDYICAHVDHSKVVQVKAHDASKKWLMWLQSLCGKDSAGCASEMYCWQRGNDFFPQGLTKYNGAPVESFQ